MLIVAGIRKTIDLTSAYTGPAMKLAIAGKMAWEKRATPANAEVLEELSGLAEAYLSKFRFGL